MIGNFLEIIHKAKNPLLAQVSGLQEIPSEICGSSARMCADDPQ